MLKSGIRLFESGIPASGDSLRERNGWAHELALATLREDLDFPLRRWMDDHALPISKNQCFAHSLAQLSVEHDQILASHEDLSFVRSPDELEVLRDLAERTSRDVKVLFVVRSVPDWIVSWKGQLRKMGYSESSNDPSLITYLEPDTWMADWRNLALVWKSVFGEESILCLDYDEAVATDGTVLPSIFRKMGIPVRLGPRAKHLRMNISTPQVS